MNRGQIVKACFTLHSSHPWERLGAFDAQTGRGPDNDLLDGADIRYKETYEMAYLKHVVEKQ